MKRPRLHFCLLGCLIILSPHSAGRADEPLPREARGNGIPEGALRRFGSAALRHGHGQLGISNAALSLDGKLLATAASKSVVVWDLPTESIVQRFPFPQGSLWSTPGLAFSPD